MGNLLSLHYLPNILWWRHWFGNDAILIDTHEYFIKQSFRNRCLILSANGPLSLTIPVKHNHKKTPVKEICIENDFAWQRQHWQAIVSALGSAAYFEHYEPYFSALYNKRFELLSEWNQSLVEVCLKLMKVEKEIKYVERYQEALSSQDLRAGIHPKKTFVNDFKSYSQVFSDKFDFVPNLSIVDLLFNQGPYSIDYLKAVI